MKRIKAKFNYIKSIIKLYNCDIEKNNNCLKSNCICNGGPCSKTTEYKFSQKRLIDRIKKILPPLI